MAAESPEAGRALAWLRAHRLPGGGILPHGGERVATQEVTGYLIPTLHALGERQLAFELARWEASVQQPDGAFTAVDGVPYTFDTAQVVRGFLAVLDELPEMEGPLRRACDFLERQIDRDGRVHTPTYAMWTCADGSVFSPYTELYVLPPLQVAGDRLGERRYRDAAGRALARFKREPDLVEFKPQLGTISHIFGYMMEALTELGETDLARRGLARAAAIQQADGSVPAYPGASWICSTGIAQLALAWYRVGEVERADRAVAYLKTIQNPSGGFYGGYGPRAQYFPDREISWAVKFFLDCLIVQQRRSDVEDVESDRGSVGAGPRVV